MKKRIQPNQDPAALIPVAPAMSPTAFRDQMELVANLASRLLEGENYSQAVQQAMALLDEAKAALNDRAMRRVPEAPVIPQSMQWDKFIRFLTGQDRFDRAENDAEGFFKFDIRFLKAKVLFERQEDQVVSAINRTEWHRYAKSRLPLVPETAPHELAEKLRQIKGSLISGESAMAMKTRFAIWKVEAKRKAASSNGRKGGRKRREKNLQE